MYTCACSTGWIVQTYSYIHPIQFLRSILNVLSGKSIRGPSMSLSVQFAVKYFVMYVIVS